MKVEQQYGIKVVKTQGQGYLKALPLKKKVTFIFNYVSTSVWSVHMRAGAHGGLGHRIPRELKFQVGVNHPHRCWDLNPNPLCKQ